MTPEHVAVLPSFSWASSSSSYCIQCQTAPTATAKWRAKVPGGGRDPEGGRPRALGRMGGPPSFMLGAGELSGEAALDVEGDNSCRQVLTVFSKHTHLKPLSSARRYSLGLRRL